MNTLNTKLKETLVENNVFLTDNEYIIKVTGSASSPVLYQSYGTLPSGYNGYVKTIDGSKVLKRNTSDSEFVNTIEFVGDGAEHGYGFYVYKDTTLKINIPGYQFFGNGFTINNIYELPTSYVNISVIINVSNYCTVDDINAIYQNRTGRKITIVAPKLYGDIKDISFNKFNEISITSKNVFGDITNLQLHSNLKTFTFDSPNIYGDIAVLQNTKVEYFTISAGQNIYGDIALLPNTIKRFMVENTNPPTYTWSSKQVDTVFAIYGNAGGVVKISNLKGMLVDMSNATNAAPSASWISTIDVEGDFDWTDTDIVEACAKLKSKNLQSLKINGFNVTVTGTYGTSGATVTWHDKTYTWSGTQWVLQ